jgi:hypothetical protein
MVKILPCTLARLCLLLCVTLACLDASANIFGSDKRIQMDQAGPFAEKGMEVIRAVGKIEGEENAGTAWILPGGCHIATNFHVVFFKSKAGNRIITARPRKGHTVVFKIGADSLKPGVFADTVKASVEDWMGYADDFQGKAQDLVVLKLDPCLGTKYGWIEYERPTYGSMPAGDLMVVAFSPSRSGLPGITVEHNCHAQDDGPVYGLFGIDCTLEDGNSGGVVLHKKNDQYKAVGVIQSRFNPTNRVLPSYHVDHRNIAIWVGSFFDFFDRVLGLIQPQSAGQK